MITLVRLLVGILLCSTLHSQGNYSTIQERNTPPKYYFSETYNEDYKIKAFYILDQKCNICHRKQNKKYVFSSENMNTWAEDIYKQVFIKKRMPRGNKIKLESEEYQDLLNWILSIKKDEYGTTI